MTCPDCEYHKRRAQIWRHQAYKLGGKPLPWEPNMTDLRKAAETALEALELLDRNGGLGLDVHEYLRTKIEALRQALAQPEQSEQNHIREATKKVEQARLEEREACAALCSAVAAGRDAEAIEEAIRARSEK